jgi:hypothetical protein
MEEPSEIIINTKFLPVHSEWLRGIVGISNSDLIYSVRISSSYLLDVQRMNKGFYFSGQRVLIQFTADSL